MPPLQNALATQEAKMISKNLDGEILERKAWQWSHSRRLRFHSVAISLCILNNTKQNEILPATITWLSESTVQNTNHITCKKEMSPGGQGETGEGVIETAVIFAHLYHELLEFSTASSIQDVCHDRVSGCC